MIESKSRGAVSNGAFVHIHQIVEKRRRRLAKESELSTKYLSAAYLSVIASKLRNAVN